MPSNAFERFLRPAGLALLTSLTLARMARADDVAVVEQKLQALEAPTAPPATAATSAVPSTAGRGPSSPPAAEPIARAREALTRARAFRNAGDELHAKVAIALAQDWTLTAEDIARAATMERDAASASKDVEEAKKRITREEAQLEEQLVRGARLRASVEAREKEVVGRPRATPDPKSAKNSPKDTKGPKGAKASGSKSPAKKPAEVKGEAP